nr:ribonuclease H-like domain-containing protein [Tanacetum cinerariifolium]GEY00647.1 ribonuclease H-like domain-containing protein [Tanacetum cinerariifolium]
MRADRFWKKTGKKISIQGTDVAGFGKSTVKCFNCHKMGHFARECRAPRSQDRGKRDNYRQGSKVEEQALKALMAIDGVGWDWSFMANEEENHAKNSISSSKGSTVTQKFPTVNRKFPTGNTKFFTAGLGNKGKAVKASACWIWKPRQNSTNKGPNSNSVSVMFKKYTHIDTQGRLKTPRQHNMYSIDLNNVVPHKDLTCLVAKASAVKSADRPTETKIDKVETAKKPTVKYAELYRKTSKSPNVRGNKRNWNNLKSHQLGKKFEMKNKACFNCGDFNHLSYDYECIVLGRNFKLTNDTNVLLRTLRQHNMYSIDLNNVVPHKDLTCLVAKSSADECTKKVAGQDVKKDVSSLRCISLPNWFHEAHLKSATSNAQDACDADAPESSGNFNPTTTSPNPLADHMETLAVETPIPIVSSPVSTACLNDSPKLSSDTRLISKRVTSQNDTPSLDNILTLTNRFEDILGVTTNTDDSNEVEADLGNMEYNISASPTPTFKIHKDHPKSQIIGPMDTPVQTITKSKEMKEQSFIPIIHQKTNLALL